MTALGRHKGRRKIIVKKSEASADVSSKTRTSGRVTIDMIKNISN
jgi:hypothetical protein